MALHGRVFRCACCDTEVGICSRCDRGQRYCSRDCAQAGQRRSQREAARRYQGTRRGRHCHAARQQRYRQRQRERADGAPRSGRSAPAHAVQASPALPDAGVCAAAPGAAVVVKKVTHRGSVGGACDVGIAAHGRAQFHRSQAGGGGAGEARRRCARCGRAFTLARARAWMRPWRSPRGPRARS